MARNSPVFFFLLGSLCLVSACEVRVAPPSAENRAVTPALAPPAPTATPALLPTATPESTPTPPAATTAAPHSTAVVIPSLIIPVAGVRAEELRDTFTEARSEGRVHNAIDIMAARGTPVLAAADGQIVRLFESERGGLTIYQLGAGQHVVYYYAHLDHYAEGLTEGREVRQGDVLGYVGNTGNAGPDNYHLHFSIWTIDDPQRFWDGENLNPYALLTR